MADYAVHTAAAGNACARCKEPLDRKWPEGARVGVKVGSPGVAYLVDRDLDEIGTKVPAEPCPNDGAEMRLLTWRELSQRNYEGAVALAERLATMRENCTAAAEILEAAAAEFKSQILEGVAGDLRQMAKP